MDFKAFCNPFILLKIIVFAVIVFLHSCNLSEKADPKVIAEVDSLINEARNYYFCNIDSSFICSQRAIEIAKRNNYTVGIIKSKGIEAYNYLSLGEDSLAFVYYQEMDRLAQDVDDQESKGLVYAGYGNYYRKVSMFDLALTNFFKAISCFEESNSKKKIAKTYLDINMLYHKKQDSEKSLECLFKAKDIAGKHDFEELLAAIEFNIGSAYYDMGKYDDAANSYLTLLNENGEYADFFRIRCYNNLASIEVKRNNPEQAEKYTIKGYELCNKDNEEVCNYLLLNFVDVYRLKKDYNRAVLYAEELYSKIEGSRNYRMLKVSSENLSELYEETGDIERSLYFYKRHKEAEDSLYNWKNTERFAEIATKDKYEKILLEKEQKRQKRNLYITLILIGLLIFVLFLVILLRNLRSRNTIIRLKNQALENDMELKELTLLKSKQEKQLVEKDLEFKQTELITKELNLAEKREFIAHILKHLQKVELYDRKNISKEVSSLINELKTNLKDNIWDEFDIRFKELHGDFYKILDEKYPSLTINEKRMCAYLRLNLSIKEIAKLVHQKPQSIATARYRLRKKLNIPQESNIHEFLQDLKYISR